MLNIGVIGVGVMGGGHARMLTREIPGTRVVAVADPDTDRAAALAAELGGVGVWNAEAIIASPDIDAVVVASPDPTHPELAIACIAAGKPVLMEKPLASDPAGALTVVEAEAACGRQLVSLGFMRRFDPSHQAIHQATLRADGIGKPLLFRGIHRNPSRSQYANSRSTVSSSGIHDIDSARWFMGEFLTVSAVGLETQRDGVPDLVHFQGTHANGGFSTIEVWVSAVYGYEVSAELVGERGTAITMDPDRATLRLANRRGTDVPGDWMSRFDDAYRLELHAWVNSCTGGPAFPGATAWDGYRDQVVAEAVIESLASGAVISIPS